MAKLKILLVHPDPDIRTCLRKFLAQADFLEVVGEAVSGPEAMELARNINYGGVFTGVDLPGPLTGFELAGMIKKLNPQPAIVLLAEKSDEAYLAFELGALDYLLPPLEKDRIEMTIGRLKGFKTQFGTVPEPTNWSVGEETTEETVKLSLADDEEEQFVKALKSAWDQEKSRSLEIEKLPVTVGGKTVLIPYDRIIFLEAYEDYCYVHTADQKFLTSFRLKNLEDRLGPHKFFRVHRKYLVNLDMVTEIASMPGSNFMLRTAGKTRIELPVSRRRIGPLKEILGL